MSSGLFLRRATALLTTAWLLTLAFLAVPQDQTQGAAPVTAPSKTRIALVAGRWHINDKITNFGSRAEGLLMNVRMVNATFEDANSKTRPPAFDADRNTARFIEQIQSYATHGVNAFTLCLQGGMPGYEGALNSAFESDGSLRPEYLSRVARVIDACDDNGLAVILGCYYQRQSKVLRDDDALRAGVINVVDWIRSRGWQNVLLEVANEYPHRGFAHPLIRDPKGQASLLRTAKERWPQLLVTASGYGTGLIDAEVAQACDFLSPHFNSTPIEQIDDRLKALQRFGKPIVVNEDDKTAQQASAALEACVAAGASYGLMLQQHNQRIPFHFDGAADDPVFYANLKLITSPARQSTNRPGGAASYFPPPDIQGGWRTPESADDARRLAGVDIAKFDDAFAAAKASTKNGGLLVIRRGWLVYERYFGLGNRHVTPNLASCGKSFTSIAVGVLMAERPELFPDGLHQKIFTPNFLPQEAFPLSDPRKAEIQLGQLLSFTAGIRGNNPCRVRGADVMIDPAGPDGSSAMIDAVALGLRDTTSGGRPTTTKTLWCEPGEGYSYATASAHLASMMVRHVSGMELEAFVRSQLAEPLGFGLFTYGYKQFAARQHAPGGGGIAVRATDMLRFGYLLLREGRWGDRQLVPAAYVRHCGHASPFNPHAPYSLQFDVNTDGHIPEFPRDAFWKAGSGGHTLYVVPSLDLVVWKLGGRDAQYDKRDTGNELNPGVVEQAPDRSQWTASISDRDAQRQVLSRVIAAIIDDARGQNIK